VVELYILMKTYFINEIVFYTEVSDSAIPAADDEDAWVVANVQQYGYYRVNYDATNWRALSKQLQTDHTVTYAE
jgi:hypothetical protein